MCNIHKIENYSVLWEKNATIWNIDGPRGYYVYWIMPLREKQTPNETH